MATSGSTLTWFTDGSPVLAGDAWLLFGLMDTNSDGAVVEVTGEYQANVTVLEENVSYWTNEFQRIQNGTVDDPANNSVPRLTW